MKQSLFISFLSWFFVTAPSLILRTGGNFLLWGWHFFSIGYFVPRLLSPWHRDISSYGLGFDFKRFFHTFGWNLISRVIGAVMRVVVLSFGIVVEAGIGAVSISVFLAWYLLPVAIPGLFVLGFFTLILS